MNINGGSMRPHTLEHRHHMEQSVQVHTLLFYQWGMNPQVQCGQKISMSQRQSGHGQDNNNHCPCGNQTQIQQLSSPSPSQLTDLAHNICLKISHEISIHYTTLTSDEFSHMSQMILMEPEYKVYHLINLHCMFTKVQPVENEAKMGLMSEN